MPSKLDAIRNRTDQATKGPWVAKWDSCAACGGEWYVDPLIPGDHAMLAEESDADFIAHSREDIPLLLAVAMAAKEIDIAAVALMGGNGAPDTAYVKLGNWKKLHSVLAQLDMEEQP